MARWLDVAEEKIGMNFHIPIEVFDTLLVFLLGAIWYGYRRIWRHIRGLEFTQSKILLMLRNQGLVIPDKHDTEVFRRANNFDTI